MRKNQKVFILWAIITTICAISSAEELTGSSTGNPPDLDAIVEKARSMRLQLRKETITSIATPNDPNTKTNVLQDFIKKLDALKLPETVTQNEEKTVPPKKPEQTIKKEATPVVLTISAAKQAEQTKKEIFNNKINALLEKPDIIVNPLAVADELYKGTDYDNAVKFYNLALKRMSTQTDPPDRPWALFQAANCLRHADTAEAAKLYQQLISEFPNSHWTPAAMLQNSIITWSAANNPLKLMEKYLSDPNSI